MDPGIIRNSRDNSADLRGDTLRQREALLHELGNNLPDGVIYQVVRRRDGSNYFPYMSAGLERTFELSTGEAMWNPAAVYDRILPEDLRQLRAAADESIRTMTPFDVECRLRTRDGAERWLHLRGRPRRLPDGATLWDAIALDVTDRKRVEKALREREAQLLQLAHELRRSEERYRQLFERNFVGIFRTRGDGILMECNDAFARILGYAHAAEARGWSILDHYATPADRERIVRRLSAGEEVTGVEVVARRRDGSSIPVSMSVRRIVDESGPIHEGVLVDLTERKQAEEAATLRSVAELGNAAAHEINNPLTTIVGQLALMADGADPAQRIERMQAAAVRIRDIVKHMEQITRLERSTESPADLPLQMLDIRRSSAQRDGIAMNSEPRRGDENE